VKGVVLLTLYLARDTVARWLEQPAGVIAKASVVGFMVATATAILASFALAADELERRLAAVGLDRIYVRETTVSTDRRAGLATMSDLLTAGATRLGPGASVVELFGTPVRATLSVGLTLPVFLYDPDRPPRELAPLFADADGRRGGVALLTDRVPPGAAIEAVVPSPLQTPIVADATSVPAPDWALGVEPAGLLLAPVGGGLGDLRTSPFRLTVLERGPGSPGIATLTDTAERLARAEGIDATVRGPGPILDSLEDLRGRRDLVRAALAVVFGAGAAFVFAAMGVLEYREVRFVGALLRSFGTSPRALFARHAVEQLLLANAGVAGALAIMWFTRVPAVEALGYPVGADQASALAGIVAPEVRVIALIMNAGVVLGMLPVAWLVAKPVGRVLS